MSYPHSNIIRVKLVKQPRFGLGFLIRQRSKSPQVIVSDLVSGGMAAESGLVQIGDMVLKVNETNLDDISYEESVKILKSLPINSMVVLILKGPEGYTSYLETRFSNEGIPKTIRVTKPIISQDSFMDRIKKTFIYQTSPKPCQSKQTQANCGCTNNHRNGIHGGLNGTLMNGGVNTSVLMNDNHVNGTKSKGKKSKNHEKSLEESWCMTDAGDFDQKRTLDVDKKVANGVEKYRSSDKVQPHSCLSGINDEKLNSKKTIDSINNSLQKNNAILSSESDGLSEGQTPCGNSNQKTTKESNSDASLASMGNVVSVMRCCDRSKTASVNITVQSDNTCDTNDSLHENANKHSDNGVKEDIGNGSVSTILDGNRQTIRPPSSPSTYRKGSLKKFVKLRNVGDERPICTDTLHQKASEPIQCTPDHCLGSVMDVGLRGSNPRSKEEVLVQAKDFIDQYYVSIKRQNTPPHIKRWQDVERCIQDTGTYELTTAELTYGAKTAWRNAARCIGRIQWSKLQVFDARHITTARGMFEAICNHIKYGTNKGNIRSAITIFPPRTDGKHDFRVWNPQFIRYAGYKQDDGTVIGDPSNVEITDICTKLGWKGKGTRFDVLPLVLQANGHDPEIFEIPSDLVLEVPIKHPKLPWFADMGLRWYALPAVSNMIFDCGGLEFVGAPFNGWYMGTEIGARDFCDKYRYNLLEDIAERMGFDTRKSSSLWKDRTLVEINVAVLHSFQSMGVTITDHHAASESFMKHLDNEQKLRGGCPADWVWVVPPMSGSILPVFHQEMLVYKLRPSFEYQENPWKNHVWKRDRDRTKSNSDRPRRKIGFRELARAVKFSAKLMGKALARRVKCTILYGTETGKSEGFSKTLCQIFKHAFDAKVMCMNEYDVIELEHEALVLIVTSTFGNGDPPENGEEFAKSLFEMKHPEKASKLQKQTSYIRLSVSDSKDELFSKSQIDDSDDNLNTETGPLANIRYSVFGLGSSAYPNFCAFAHFLDKTFVDLGAERILNMSEGDELCGQEESFTRWAQDIFKAACDTFCVGDERTLMDAAGDLSKTDHSWSSDKFRITPANGEKETDIIDALSKVHGKNVMSCKFIEKKQLQAVESDRQTILVKLDTQGAQELHYTPGDHLAIFPQNSPELVDTILIRLHNAPPSDQMIKIELLSERTTLLGTLKTWDTYPKFPVCSLRTAFTHFLDITTPPSMMLLKILAAQATKDCDRERLENLTNDPQLYEEWKYDSYPNIVQVLDEFPSLRIPPSLLLTQLPILQQRYYSISSSPTMCPGEIHATVAVVRYRTQGDTGPVHEGVCSTWLNRQDVGQTIPCVVRHAPAFHMPHDSTRPMILVGPGTGIAPFRSFWQQRKIDKETLPVPESGQRKGWGDIYLYFGCRRSGIDDIYQQELAKAKDDGVIKEVHTALSREPEQPKTYVQNILKKNAADVYRIIVKEGGHFYVCGDVKMASDVTATLEQIMMNEGNMSKDVAKDYIRKLQDGDRFHEDIFGVTLRSSEVTDRARDQAKKTWNFIKTAGSPAKSGVLEKETVVTIPSDEQRAPRGKPKAPQKTMFPTETAKT